MGILCESSEYGEDKAKLLSESIKMQIKQHQCVCVSGI